MSEGNTQSPDHAQLERAKSAALKAGEIIRSYHSVGRSNNSALVCVKSGVDLVTEADTRVEKLITEMIKNAFPNDIIIGEEDYASCPLGSQDEPFPNASILCIGEFYDYCHIFSMCLAQTLLCFHLITLFTINILLS